MSNPHIYGKMPFDVFKDLVPVASVSSNQLVLAVHPSVPANNLREFVELARRSPSRPCSTPRSATAASIIWRWSF